MELSTQVQMISPDVAEALLMGNEGNRTVSRTTVSEYANAMKRGEWQLNGEPIIIGRDGRLLNGQHRCLAVIASKTTIQALVVSGVSEEAFKTLDTGKKRNAYDVLSMSGVKNAHVVASAARTIMRIENGAKPAAKFTNTAILETIERYENIHGWAGKFVSSNCRSFMTSAIVGVLTIAERRHGHETVLKFWLKVSEGVGLTVNDPAYQLRERFINQKSGQRFTTDFSTALCIKAINAEVMKQKVKILRWGMTEAFPELV